MHNKAYWISLLVGVIVIIILFYNSPSRREGFESAPPCTIDTTGKFTEDITGIIEPSKVAVYLSSFSDYIAPATPAVPPSTEALSVYCQASQKWNNMKQGLASDGSADSFFIATEAVLPTTIRQNGLPLNGTKLRGPPSNFFADPITNQLGSFTMAFYCSFTDLNNATTENPVVLWRMYAETTSTGTPIMVQFAVLPNPTVTSEVIIRMTIGDVNADQRMWSIPKSTLVSSNMPLLYAITYDIANTRKAYFYAGSAVYKADPYYDTVSQIPPIKLTSTEVYINQNGNINGSLYAFLWYSGFLETTAINGLNAYFTQQWTGTPRDLSGALQTAANALKGLQAQTQTIASMQAMLDTCKVDKEACVAMIPKKTDVLEDSVLKKWMIALSGDLGSASIQDLAACSPLWIRNMTGSPIGVKIPDAAALTPNVTGLPKNYVIGYPSASAASASPVYVPPTPAQAPASTPAPASTSTNNNKKTVQTTITTTTDSDTKNLNQNYQDILKALEDQSITIDETKKNSPLENTILQDKSKTEEDTSFWNKVKTWMGF